MFDLKASRTAIVTDLTCTRHMAAVAAVVFGSIFVPLVGGPVQNYEIAEIRSVLFGDQGTVTPASVPIATAAAATRAETPRGDVQEAARPYEEDTAELTTLELIADVELQPDLLGGDETLLTPEAVEEPMSAPELPEVPAIEPESVEPNA